MRNVLLGISVTLLLLLLLESCGRVVYSIRDDFAAADSAPSMVPLDMVPSDELGWERRPNYKGPVIWGSSPILKEYDTDGYFTVDTRQAADSSVPRIITLGDSSTFGWGVPTESSYAEILDELLPNAHVINLGLNGYTTYQGYKVLEKYAPVLKPSMAITSFNFNDRRYVLLEGPDDEAKFQQFAAAGSGSTLLERFALVRILRAAARRVHLIPSEKEPDTDIRTIQARVPPEAYRQNLIKIARYCRENRIALIFMLLGDNPFFSAPLRAGIDLLQASRTDDAIRVFNAVATANMFHSEIARKYLVQAYEIKGDSAGIKRMAHIPRPQNDISGGRCIYPDSEYNRIMEEVAHEQNVKLVNARPTLDEDPTIYLDFCHPGVEGHRKIAELLRDAVTEAYPTAHAVN
jgi:lysophospholipase L1-like esterase